MSHTIKDLEKILGYTEDQAKALRLLVSNCTLTGETIEPNYKKPFDLVAEGVKTGNWYAREDSNL